MGNAMMYSLMVVICTASVAYGENRKISPQTEMLAKELTSKAVCRKSTVLARAGECRLHIIFEKMNAAFDLPLQGTSVAPSDSEDAIVVKNRHMTRTINGRAPEPFEQLTLRFQRDMIGPMLKNFNDAIATCTATRAIAATN